MPVARPPEEPDSESEDYLSEKPVSQAREEPAFVTGTGGKVKGLAAI
jgi:hypothetical protein